jgi:hypothetical protein
MPKSPELFFGTTNAKTARLGIATFSLPAGHTCPGAKDCLAKRTQVEKIVKGVPKMVNKLIDGEDTKFRCYAASMEVSFSSVGVSVDRNLAKLKAAKTVEGMTDLIDGCLPPKMWHTIRVHSGGDFFNFNYFLAWMEVARRNPRRKFYAYTKSLPFWVKAMALIPSNFVLTASYGGKWDKLIEDHKLKHSIVVYHPEEAERLGIEIDHDEKLARNPRVLSFGLLIHGQQKAGTVAAAAKKRLEVEGVPHTYSRVSSKFSAVG